MNASTSSERHEEVAHPSTTPVEHMEPLAIGDQRLERRIGWVMGAMMNVSYIIGAGIFVGPALTLKLVGSGGMNIVVWVIGAIVAMSGTWTFAELGTMLPRSGGEIGYLEYAFRKPKLLLAYIFTMWSLMNRSSGVAAQGIIFGGYMNYAIHGPNYKSAFSERGWAIFCSTILTIGNIMSTKVSMKFMAGLTVLKLSVLLLISIIGVFVLLSVMPSDAKIGSNLSFAETTTSIGPYASALYYVMNSYSGWHNLNYLLDEVKDPIKNLPKASSAALVTTATLYVMVNIAYLSVLPLDTMKNSEFIVAASFFTKSLGENFATTILPVLIALSAFGCAASINFSSGRIIIEAARSGLIPFGDLFGRVNPTLRSPVNAYLLQFVLTVIFAIAPPGNGVYPFIVAFIAFPVYIFYGLIALAVLILRKREPYNNRPIRAPTVCVVSFLCFSTYAVIFVFIPVDNEYYPYWVPYVSAIISMLLSTIFWYYQIVIRDTPGKSYNQTVRNQGHVALEQEIFGEYAPLPADEELFEQPVEEPNHTVGTL